MCEYPHRMSRLGYAGLEDELVSTLFENKCIKIILIKNWSYYVNVFFWFKLKTMDPKDIDRATLWKKAREDKSGNIPDEKAKQKGNRIVSSDLLLFLSRYIQILV